MIFCIKKIVLFISISLLFLNCNSQTLNDKKLLQLKSQSEIKIKNTEEKGYNKKGLLYCKNKPFLFFYNKDSSKIILNSFLDNSIKKIELKKIIDSNILKFERIDDISFLNDDSLIILFNEHIFGYSFTNKIYYNKRINIQINDQWPHHTINSFSDVAHLTQDTINNIVYLRNTPSDISRNSKNYYKSEILGALSLKTYEIEYLPIYYPDFYKKNYVGDLETYQLLQNNGNLYVSFLANQEIVKFNYKSKKCELLKHEKSDLDNKKIKWFKWNKSIPIKERMDKIVESPIYDQIMYCKALNVYLRFIRTGVEPKNPDGTFNNKFDKKNILMILDSNFTKLKEFEFPEDVLYDSYYAFIKDNNLYINNQNKDAKEKNYTHFDIFNIDSMQIK